MKKLITTLIFVCVVATGTFAQSMSDTSLLNAKTYTSYFFNDGRIRINSRYVEPATDEDFERFSVLGGDITNIDTPLEFALLSYYSPAVIQIRPDEAKAILPADNPRLAGLKLGAAVFQDIQVLRFLNDTAAVNRHEAILQYITGRGNATRAEIEQYYRSGIRALISEVVSEEFNKISFSFENAARTKGYNAVLTSNSQNGQYILSHEDVRNVTTELPPQTLEALLATMRRDTDNFDQACVNAVRAQAALIPAVAYESINNTTELTTLINILTDFYISPTQASYRRLLNEYSVHRTMSMRQPEMEPMYASLRRTLTALNPALADRVARD